MALFIITPSSAEWSEFVSRKYTNHSTHHIGDAGLDLFCPSTTIVPANARGFMYDLQIVVRCQEVSSAVRTSPFWLLPRSSTGMKTPLRLSNSVGLIDGAYRGHLCALLDNLSDKPFEIKEGERLFQICTRTLDDQFKILVDNYVDRQSSRGEGGFGSTGK